MLELIAGCLFWGGIILALFLLRPSAKIQQLTIEKCEKKEWIIVGIVMLLTILLCVLPMSINPYYNGEKPDHRNQYELLAEAILEGHFDIRYDWADDLTILDNPYSPAERDSAGVKYPLDHAYYKGHYYVYFGIVPVILLFLPYLIVTGSSLTTYHTTQIFVAFIILGLFALFWQMAKKWFKELTFGLYLALAVSLSIMSVWYSIDTPALYCTAITAGICMEVWSLYFFVKGVFVESNETRRTIFAFIGALFGALAFGCRPPIALVNILVIPMLIYYVKGRSINKKLILQLIFVALPYVIVGILLMLYNYVRFDSFTEFGQTYQLTAADQSNYGSLIQRLSIIEGINGLYDNLFCFAKLSHDFPYIQFNGAFINFPILFFVFFVFYKPIKEKLKDMDIKGFIYSILLVPIIVTMLDVIYSPWLLERYRMDIYFIMGILCFAAIGFLYQVVQNKRRYLMIVSVMAIYTVFCCFMLFLIPDDWNYTYVFPEALDKVKSCLSFGLFKDS